ncbi:pleckstrin homology domain-containing family B member 2-like isoform X1 [Sander lucioperca]|uniref:pleckstrin homology domain-containing family B member 2-like isoform X1 n=1 Tax=Sander lucioperca TaxID=283035 RepID=UPI00125D06AD|nr:pleckstrin homology domain-containing family B member 2-like isoform X1 [Sander lucioperca]
MAMVKSGWLHRQSTILHRWKRNWFDLWVDGWLVFYNNQQRRDMEDDIDMRDDCIDIRNFYACQELNPPEGKMRDAFLQIVCRDGRVISLCADSAYDALAWTMVLQDARINAVVATPQIGFAQEVIASDPPPYSEYAPPPQLKGINSMHMNLLHFRLQRSSLPQYICQTLFYYVQYDYTAFILCAAVLYIFYYTIWLGLTRSFLKENLMKTTHK